MAVGHNCSDRAMADEAASPRPKPSRQALEVAHGSPQGLFVVDERNAIPDNPCGSAAKKEESRSWVHQTPDQGRCLTTAKSTSSTYSSEALPLSGEAKLEPGTTSNSSTNVPQSVEHQLLTANLPSTSNSQDRYANSENSERSKSLHFDNDCSAGAPYIMKDPLVKCDDPDAKTVGEMRVAGGGSTIKLFENPPFGGWGDKSSSNVITAFPMYKARALQKLSTSRNANRNVPTLTEEPLKLGGLFRRGSPFRVPPLRRYARRKRRQSQIRFVLPSDDGAKPSRENVAAKSSPHIRRARNRFRNLRQCNPLLPSRQRDEARELPDMRYVYDVVETLVNEFEPQPITKPSPPRSPRSLLVSRVSSGRLRRKSATRTRSSSLGGYKKRRLQPPYGRRRASRSPGNVSLALHSTSESESSSDSRKKLDNIWTVCSLLESITGHVKTEAQRLYMPEALSPAFQEDVGGGGSKEYLRRKGKYAEKRGTREFPAKLRTSQRRRSMRRPWARKERSQQVETSEPSMDGHHQRQLKEPIPGAEPYSAGTEPDSTGTSVSDRTIQSSTDAEHSLGVKEKIAHYTKGPKRKKVHFLTNLVLRSRRSAGDRLSKLELKQTKDNGDRLSKSELKQTKDNIGRISETTDGASSSSSSVGNKYLPRGHTPGRSQGSSENVDRPADVSQVESFGSPSPGNRYLQNSRKHHYSQDERRRSTDLEQRSSTESSLRSGAYDQNLDQVALRRSHSTLNDSTRQWSETMQKPPQLDKRHWPSSVEPVAHDLPLFRARIARRSNKPSGRPAMGKKDQGISSNENSSFTSPLAQASSATGTDSSGKDTLADTAGSSHALTDTPASTPVPKRPSRSLSIGIELPPDWSTGPDETSAPVSISAVVHQGPRRKLRPKSRQREPPFTQTGSGPSLFPEISHTIPPMLPGPEFDSPMIGQNQAMQASASLPPSSEPLSLPASSKRMLLTPPVCSIPGRPGERKLSANRLSMAPHGKQRNAARGSGAVILQSEFHQPDLLSSPQVAPSGVNSMSCGGSFVTALDAAGTGPDFDRTTAEALPAQFMTPTVAATPGALALFQPAGTPILQQSRRSQSSGTNQSRVPSFFEGESSSARQSGEMTLSSSVSDIKVRPRYNEYGSVRRLSSPHQWEQKNPTPAGNSMNSIISRGLPQLSVRFMKNFKGTGPTVLYVILVAGTLAGIIAGFSLHMYSSVSLEDNQDGGDADNVAPSSMYLPLFEREVGPSAKPNSCHNPSCSEQVALLVRSLDASVRPCHNFYGHVCSLRQADGTADDQLKQRTESKVVDFFKGIGSPDRDLPVAAASRRLWQDCVDLTTLSRLGKVPLQTLLKLTGLSEWPYGAGNAGAAALPDVWKTAGQLLRLMALSPLVDVSVTPNDTVQLLRGDVQSGSGEADDVLDAMLMLRRNSSRLREVAADVAALGRQLSGLLDRQPPPASPEDEKDVVPFLETVAKGLGFVDAGVLRTQPASFLEPLLKLVHSAEPQTVLNLLGYQLVRHVDLFTPSAVKADLNSGAVSSRESQCARTVLEGALTGDEAEYVRYAALRNQLDFDLLRSMAEQLKHALVAKLPGLRWFDANTLRKTQRRFRELKVRFFFDRYEGDSQTLRAKPPVALPSQALFTYQRFREARFRSRLTKRSAVDAVGDQHCAYDAEHEALYVRLSVVDIRSPDRPLWPALQVARMGPRVSRCLLNLLVPQSPPGISWPQMVNRSSAPHARLDKLLTCLRSQPTRDNPAGQPKGPSLDELSPADLGALGPAKEVFDTYVARTSAKATDTKATGSDETLSWDQVFYTAYAHSMCENHPDHPQRSAQPVPRWARVNRPLSNDPGFLRAFQCLRGDPMRPDAACRFWGPSQ